MITYLLFIRSILPVLLNDYIKKNLTYTTCEILCEKNCLLSVFLPKAFSFASLEKEVPVRIFISSTHFVIKSKT